MAVVAADKKIDFDKLKKISGNKKIDLASPDKVKELTGLSIGAVPPFGNLFDLKVFVDKSLGKTQIIAFNAGTHTDSIKMKYSDYKSVVNPNVCEFAK